MPPPDVVAHPSEEIRIVIEVFIDLLPPFGRSDISLSSHNHMKVQKSDHPHSWDPCVNYCLPPNSTLCNASSTLNKSWTASNNNTINSVDYCKSLVSASFSSGSNATSGPSSQSSSTLPRPSVPMSPRNSLLKRRQRKKEHKSSLSLASSSVGPGGQVVHVETSEVVLLGDPLNGFGANEAGDYFPIWGTCQGFQQLSVLTANRNLLTLTDTRAAALLLTLTPASKKTGEPLIISDIKKGSMAHRTGTLEPGDKLLAIDNIRLENCSRDDAEQILQQCEELVKLKIRKDEDNSEI
ncbi:unnamed protein product [Menidia menidia]|uniref:(Atlantic silverside) hypothetical protein n=1 Tax=Menidia menidia TaxID=238744 RepID=A0A8S4BP08_9TELE|nr:unnamed protein product [Menidia menidia]